VADAGPPNFNGTFSLSFTLEDNLCSLPGADTGAVQSDVVLEVSGTGVSATFQGAAGDVIKELVGQTSFDGTQTDASISLTDLGTVPVVYTPTGSTTSCTTRWNATMAATVSGDTLTGTLTFDPTSSTAGLCKYESLCEITDSFTGPRQ
jgi:hypothetical protein